MNELQKEFFEEIAHNSDEDGSYNSSEELMPPALPLSEEQSEQEETPIETLKAYEFLKKGRTEASLIDKSKLFCSNSSNIKIIPINLPKDYQKKEEDLPKVFVSQNVEWKENTLKRFLYIKNELDNLKQNIKSGKSIHDIIDNLQENIVNIELFVNNDDVFMQNYKAKSPNYQFPPSLSILLYINSLRAISLLELILYDIEENLKTKSVCTYHQALWIYSLLSCLEKPLLMESCGLLVRILKILFQFMNFYDKNFNDYSSYIGMMNVIILIINEYFGQKILNN